MFDNMAGWISLGLNVLILTASVAGFIKITQNDLAHVQKSLDKIDSDLSKIGTKLENTTERIASIEGKCKANHG
jgi:peptidoglycan hydrolase CwlO-like protein